MSKFTPHFDTEDGYVKLPIIAQLSVLLLILGGMFGVLFFHNVGLSAPAEEPESQTVYTATTAHTVTPQKFEEVKITAQAAYVFDVREQRVLFAKNENKKLPLASITKLMTALVAHELVSDNTSTRISETAIRQDGDYGLFEGELFSISELERFALIASSNDAAFALGAAVGELLGSGDPNEQFVKAMNIRAEELGLDSLSFSNSTGLDLSVSTPGATGTAKDVSFLMEYIIENYPEIVEPTREGDTRVYSKSGTYHDIENTNEYISSIPNLIGSKTGYTDLAGGNLTIAFDLGLNRPIIITVLGSTRSARFTDVLELVDAVQNNVR